MAQPERQLLKVHCLTGENANFGAFVGLVKKSIQIAAESAKKEGTRPPLAIIPHEFALNCCFDVKHAEMLSFANHLQSILPTDAWTVVAFSAFQLDEKGAPANMMHVITKGRYECQPKRKLAESDVFALTDAFLQDEGKFGIHYDSWMHRSAALSHQDEQFITRKVPDGALLEFRVCCDVGVRPLIYEPEKITIVLAGKLDEKIVKDFSLSRKAVLVNKATQPLLQVESFGGIRFKIEPGNEFSSVSLYEDVCTGKRH